MLDAVKYAKSKNHVIGTQVVSYADDLDEQVAVSAMELCKEWEGRRCGEPAVYI